MSVLELFLKNWGGVFKSSEYELRSVLELGIEKSKAQWPKIKLDSNAFIVFLAKKMKEESVPSVTLSVLYLSDLWLVFGTLSGDKEAMHIFDLVLRKEVDRIGKRMSLDLASKDDLAQDMREKLLVSKKEGGPGLHGYGGVGPLGRWMEIIALRMQLNALRKVKEIPVEEQPILDAILLKDKVFEPSHEEYFAEFVSAFSKALKKSDKEARQVLRLAYLDKFDLDRIGKFLGVSRATAHRRLVSARKLVAEQTSVHLKEEVLVSTELLTQIQRLVSMSRLLAAQPPTTEANIYYS